jgi:hypothetical protein
MAVASITAALSIIQGLSSFASGILDKEAQTMDAIQQYDLASENLLESRSIIGQNIQRNRRSDTQLRTSHAEQLNALGEDRAAQKGRNLARLGASALTLDGSPADIARKNALKYRADRGALMQAQATEREALFDERAAFERDSRAITRQLDYISDARARARETIASNGVTTEQSQAYHERNPDYVDPGMPNIVGRWRDRWEKD